MRGSVDVAEVDLFFGQTFARFVGNVIGPFFHGAMGDPIVVIATWEVQGCMVGGGNAGRNFDFLNGGLSNVELRGRLGWRRVSRGGGG